MVVAAIVALLVLSGGSNDTPAPEAAVTSDVTTAQSATTSPATTSPASTSTPETAPPVTDAATEVAGAPPESTRIFASSVEASSSAPSGVDSADNAVTYGPQNVNDGAADTTWRTAGDGVGERLVVRFARPTTVTEVGLIAGYDKVDPFDGVDRFTQNRRVRSVRYTFSNGATVVHDLADVRNQQTIDVDALATSVVIEILESTDHGGRDYAAISEVFIYGYDGDGGSAGATSSAEDEALVHVFPLEPANAASYSPGGHAYPATDLFASTGTRFVAVTDGVVDEVSRVDLWDPATDDPALRAGLYVSVIGGDGVRYYGSHLSVVADGVDAGTVVSAGQLLGEVGRTGNARDTPSHLHFGISRPTFAGDWEVRRGEIDPVPFLLAWSAGDTAAVPDLAVVG